MKIIRYHLYQDIGADSSVAGVSITIETIDNDKDSQMLAQAAGEAIENTRKYTNKSDKVIPKLRLQKVGEFEDMSPKGMPIDIS